MLRMLRTTKELTAKPLYLNCMPILCGFREISKEAQLFWSHDRRESYAPVRALRVRIGKNEKMRSPLQKQLQQMKALAGLWLSVLTSLRSAEALE